MSEDDFFDTRSKAYVRHVLETMRLSPSALAKKANLSATTLTRALNDPSHRFTLSMSTLGKIYQVSGINFQSFFEPDGTHARYRQPRQIDIYDPAGDAKSDDRNGPAAIPVVGESAIGVWRSLRVIERTDFGLLLLAFPDIEGNNAFALRCGDDSAAPFVLRGEFAVCVRRGEDENRFRHGDLVVIERGHGNDLIELTIRRVIFPEGLPPYLRLDNVDPEFSERLPMDPSVGDTRQFKIVGFVRYSVREVADAHLEEESHQRVRRGQNPR